MKKGKVYKLKRVNFSGSMKIEFYTLDRFRIVEIGEPKRIRKLWSGIQNTLNRPKSNNFNRNRLKKRVFEFGLLEKGNPLS